MSRTYKDHSDKITLSRHARRRMRLRLERKEKTNLFRAVRQCPNSLSNYPHHD